MLSDVLLQAWKQIYGAHTNKGENHVICPQRNYRGQTDFIKGKIKVHFLYVYVDFYLYIKVIITNTNLQMENQ